MERALSVPMLVAALLVVPVILVEESSLDATWQDLASVVNWAIWLAFLLEAVAMLWVVDDRGRWLREHPVEIVIVVLTPPFLSSALASLRVLRLLRLVRLLRLAKVARHTFSLAGVKYTALLALVVVVGGGQAFASAEPDRTVGEGIYWAITTMTTVGYGDPPVTTETGKVIAIAVMLVGIGFVAVLTGAIAERFLASDVEPEIERVESEEAAILAELRNVSERLAALEVEVRRGRA